MTNGVCPQYKIVNKKKLLKAKSSQINHQMIKKRSKMKS